MDTPDRPPPPSLPLPPGADLAPFRWVPALACVAALPHFVWSTIVLLMFTEDAAKAPGDWQRKAAFLVTATCSSVAMAVITGAGAWVGVSAMFAKEPHGSYAGYRIAGLALLLWIATMWLQPLSRYF